ncbi:hypothetical protein PLICRDRAFT_41336 [Plicaturopsis crispa FD-325 SS-3]|nr:hypothetical protein PLICRDRAFT_41336 [Plicaturopsis crispa FD-325 SS-3]
MASRLQGTHVDGHLLPTFHLLLLLSLPLPCVRTPVPTLMHYGLVPPRLAPAA